MIEISKRLEMIASCTDRGKTVADVGTDHAYLPIYLIQNNLAEHVIAMDVNKGPLEKAEKNIRAAGVSHGIELRMSDGLSKLAKDEADVITISGMGGRLMERILTDGRSRISSKTKLILSPQSELMHFREYLLRNGFVTDDEKMLKEDGKYYVIIVCHLKSDTAFAPAHESCGDVTAQYAELKYGKMLIERKDSVLKEYIASELEVFKKLRGKLEAGTSANAKERISQIDKEIKAALYALGK